MAGGVDNNGDAVLCTQAYRYYMWFMWQLAPSPPAITHTLFKKIDLKNRNFYVSLRCRAAHNAFVFLHFLDDSDGPKEQC